MTLTAVQSSDVTETIPPNLYLMAAILIREGFLSLEDIYPHVRSLRGTFSNTDSYVTPKYRLVLRMTRWMTFAKPTWLTSRRALPARRSVNWRWLLPWSRVGPPTQSHARQQHRSPNRRR